MDGWADVVGGCGSKTYMNYCKEREEKDLALSRWQSVDMRLREIEILVAHFYISTGWLSAIDYDHACSPGWAMQRRPERSPLLSLGS